MGLQALPKTILSAVSGVCDVLLVLFGDADIVVFVVFLRCACTFASNAAVLVSVRGDRACHAVGARAVYRQYSLC